MKKKFLLLISGIAVLMLQQLHWLAVKPPAHLLAFLIRKPASR